MSDDSIRRSIDIVVAVDVYHHSRRLHKLNVYDAVQSDIRKVSVYRNKLQGSLDLPVLSTVSVLGVRIDLVEHESQAVSESGAADIKQPIVSLSVLCEIGHGFAIGVKEIACKSGRET